MQNRGLFEYKLNDIFGFGKYINEEVKFVFTFDPEYIEWLLINNDFFYINWGEFKDIHTCQMNISGMNDGERFGFVNISVEGNSRILSFREYLKDFFSDIYESNYLNKPEKINKFILSEKAKCALERKKYLILADKWNLKINKIITFYKENPIYFEKYKQRIIYYQREIFLSSKKSHLDKERIVSLIFEYANDVRIEISISTVKNNLNNSSLTKLLDFITKQIFDLNENNSFGNLNLLAQIEIKTA